MLRKWKNSISQKNISSQNTNKKFICANNNSENALLKVALFYGHTKLNERLHFTEKHENCSEYRENEFPARFKTSEIRFNSLITKAHPRLTLAIALKSMQTEWKISDVKTEVFVHLNVGELPCLLLSYFASH